MHSLILCALGAVLSQDPQPTASAATIEIRLHPAPTDQRLQWSPKGASVALAWNEGTLEGSFALGPKSAPAVQVRLEKSAGAERFDTLRIDLDRDGRIAPEERLQAQPKEQRGKWWSSFETVLAIPTQSGETTRSYPLSLWYVEDPQAEPGQQPALRWSRRGHLEGQVELEGKPAFIVVSERHMDGLFDQRDAFGLGRSIEAARAGSTRSLEAHAWLDGKAYRLCALDIDGRNIAIEAFDPGYSEGEEIARTDTRAVDRNAARAATPLAFETNFAAALQRAQREKKLVFVDFQTTWCGPCREMERWVYTARDVVEGAQHVVPVLLDGDEQRELVKRYAVGSYPTLLLLDAEGTLLARATGYQSVAETVAFLRWPRPQDK